MNNSMNNTSFKKKEPIKNDYGTFHVPHVNYDYNLNTFSNADLKTINKFQN